MTSEAQTFPQDIVKAADDVCIAMNIPSTVDNCFPIMKAILAERERCAAVADRYGKFEIDTEHGEGYATAASHIAAAIRKGGA